MAVIIKDLLLDKELDQQAMALMRGGFYFGSGTNSQNQQGQPDNSAYKPPVFGGASGISIDSSPDQKPDSLAYLQPATKHSYFY